jgi:toxin ParE1/3/4
MIVNWTEAALADLRGIEAYISRHSPQYGHCTADKIFARTERLEEFPQLGAEVPEYGDESIRELLEGLYRIVYRVYPDRVDVVAVVHSARRMPKGL